MSISENLVQPKYVAFLDVLGFKEIVNQKGAKLDRYFETITIALRDINSDKSEITSQIVSDSIILSCEIREHDLSLLLRAVQTIQYRCALENIWIRGAVTTGDIYFSNNPRIVVGNGLIEAYLLEAQEKFPRVIIDPKVIRDGGFETKIGLISKYNHEPWKRNQANIPLIYDVTTSATRLVLEDSIFVAFAERIISSGAENLKVVYDNITSELYKGQRNYQKYLWLKNYFTDVLSTNFTLYPDINKAVLEEYRRKFMLL